MAGLVRVERKLELDPAPTRMGKDAVVQGPLNEALVHYRDDFFTYTDTSFWTANVGNGGNVPAVIAAANGCINVITNGSASDVTELGGTTAMWYPRQGGLTIEARFKMTLITNVNVAFGLVNAVSATNDKTACALGADGTPTAGTNVVDAALFVYDSAMTSAKWRCVTAKADGTATAATVASGAAPVNATFETFKIEMDADGNTTFYRNGRLEGHIAAAVTVANAMIPYLGVLTRTTAARSVTPDYVQIWQKRPETSTVLW